MLAFLPCILYIIILAHSTTASYPSVIVCSQIKNPGILLHNSTSHILCLSIIVISTAPGIQTTTFTSLLSLTRCSVGYSSFCSSSPFISSADVSFASFSFLSTLQRPVSYSLVHFRPSPTSVTLPSVLLSDSSFDHLSKYRSGDTFLSSGIVTTQTVVGCTFHNISSTDPPHSNLDNHIRTFSEQCTLSNTLISDSEDTIFECFNTTLAGCTRIHNPPHSSPSLTLSHRKHVNAFTSSTDCTSTSRIFTEW